MENYKIIPESIQERYNKLTRSQNFIESTQTGTTDENVLDKRFKAVKEILID
jgi:hypothetical protein